MKTIKEILAECKGEEDFKPHMMYDPKTGKGYKANTYADHVKMDKMGYTHEKPEIKEDVSTAIFGSMLLALAPFYVMAGKAMADDLKQLKKKSAKKGFKPSKEDQSLLQKFVAMVKRKKPDAVSKAMKKANESVELEEARSSSGYELYHRDFSGAMQHAYAHAKKKGFIVDKDDIDSKVAMGPKRPSSGKTNKYILDTNKKQKLHVQVANLDNKRYELNMYIESVEEAVDTGQYGARKKPKSSKKQQQKAFDKTRKRGNDLRKMSDAEFKKWLNSDVEHDMEEGSAQDRLRAKLKKGGLDLDKRAKDRKAEHERLKKQYGIKDSFDLETHMENARAKRDAMRAMGRRGKDPADVDMDATDDDRKAASKNVLMQIRKASDLPKGGEIEFEGGKKGKISQDDAKKITKLFTMLKKPQDKAKFQKVISKDLKSIQGLLKRLGR